MTHLKSEVSKKELFGIPWANVAITLIGYALAFGYGWLLNITELYQWGKEITWPTGIIVGWVFGTFVSAFIQARRGVKL